MMARDRDYTALRRAGWTAATAWSASRPQPGDERAAELINSARQYIDWTAGRYAMHATLEPDPYADADEYGTWTNKAGPDTVPNDRADRNDFHHFRPEYSIAERIETNRGRGMNRADARDRALADARADMLRARDAAPVFLTVTASLAGVTLGRADLGGLDINPDITLPYSVALSLTIRWIGESLADLITEAIADADENRPRIAAALSA